MNTDARRRRGMTLIEVMVALALLVVSALGLVGGMVVASKGTPFEKKSRSMR